MCKFLRIKSVNAGEFVRKNGNFEKKDKEKIRKTRARLRM